MTIYIDTDFRCHVSDTGGLTPVETAAFEGKCRRYIEGHRFVPDGQSWTRPDGVIFAGEMIAPAEDIRILEAAQAAYEEALSKSAEKINDLTSALDFIYTGGVTE